MKVMPAVEVNFSDLQLHAKTAVEQMRRAPGQALLVRRRDSEDLVLTTAARAEMEHIAASVTSRVFVALMRSDPAILGLVTDVLPEVFPWVRFLNRTDVDAFVAELVETIRASDALENPAPVVTVVESWRHTAEVFADPELAAQLQSATSDDFGAVTKPGNE